ncbi:MAG: right-handed parallel beta-helix repeat-containing protein [Ruminococcus sp.]|nr:right-handed parallel beta-helix repeat-containing protein [Ruminococcus sp.]
MRNSMMKKRIMAIAASALVSVSSATGAIGGFVAPMANTMTTATAAEASVKISSAVGYAEGMYATWGAVSGASGYNVYVDGTQIDSELIRQYSGYMRADAVGLKAGSHTIKVVPIISGTPDTSKAAEAKADVYAHDRSGYAFAYGHAPGAYNNDGTLKSGAIVVYVTDANKDSVTVKLNALGKGEVDCTGVQNIITAYKKGAEKRPIAIRFIGNVTDPSVLTKGDLVLDTVTAGMTIEGIGSDATANGYGIVLKNCVDVEVRNLGFMNCDSSEGDNCGLQQSDSYCWVHNCDFFYGDAGSDADQAKGDGALDTKKSHHITHSYNHFFDNGKCNLQGANASDTSNYITYHHNWFDHSDSRHPRVRVATVHVYNNYYDGNSKYGIGSTTDSDIFAENNYFRNCKYPMLTSKQGSDDETGGTFSGEVGGVIKAYGNIIEGAKAFVPYSENPSAYDAYVAASRDEKVPSSVKAISGGASYNNFDTASDFYSYNVDAAADVPSVVMTKAGRVDGGDFKWEFNDAVDDTDYGVNSALKSALKAYDDSIVAIGSGFKEDSFTPPTTNPPSTTPSTAKPSATTTKAPSQTTPAQTNPTNPSVSGGQVHDFTANGLNSSFFSISGNLSSSKGTVTYDGKTLTQCLKIETATSISFNAGSAGKLTLVLGDASAAIKVDGTKYSASNGIVTVDLSAGEHTITKGDSTNLFYMVFGGSAGSSSTTASPSQPAQTTVTTTKNNTSSSTTVVNPPASSSSGIDKIVDDAIYCSPNGTGSGTKDSPTDVLSAIKNIKAGGTIYLLDGTYKYDSTIIIDSSNNGSANAYKTIQAYPGNSGKVVFDFSGQAVSGSNRGFVLDGDYWQFVNFEITKAGDNGMLLSGNYNRIVEMVFNDNQDTGLQLSRYDTNASTVAQWPSYNLVLNCTSKNNCDDATMENADGFAAKLTCGEGNVFDGCMAYNNSDDGWDLYAKTETGPIGVVTIKNSVAFRNGFTEFGEGYGDCDGNGFKLGGAGVGTAHIVENCLAFENLNCGFTDNNNPKLGSLKNCTAYNNGVGGNGKANYMVYRCSSSTKLDNLMSFNDTSKVSDTGAAGIKISNDKFVGVMNNSVYYNGSYYFAKSNVSMTNGAKIGDVVTVQASDFISFSVPKMGTDFHTAWRASDGSIKTGNFAESTGTYATLGYHLDGKGTASALTGQTGAAASQQTTSTTQPTTAPTSAPTTVPTTVPTTTPVTPSTGLAGDANCDGKVTIADAAAIFQYMSNSDKYTLSKQGMANADVSNKGDGITAADAIAIQKFDAGLLSKLPESVQ